MKKMYVADKETGTFIAEINSVREGLGLIMEFEMMDRENGSYVDDFYDLVDEDHCSLPVDTMLIAERVKAIRSKTGLSARAFGEKFNIPMRTIQDWERGERKAPEYVVDMLEHEVALEDVMTMVYVLYRYRDNAGAGSVETFTSKFEALERGRNEWEHMNESDKDSYINDPNGSFLVALVPAEWDDVECEYVPDLSDCDPIWWAF